MSFWALFFAISFLASVVGSICGIGGGVIIKPLLDSFNVLPVSAISFLSGCTVLAMSIISVGKALQKKNQRIDLKTATYLAIGSAVGGIVGKYLFQYAYVVYPDEARVGAIQAGVLVLITLGTLIYTILKKRIKTIEVKNSLVTLIIGLLLGMMSAFLGIGGGPINLVVLNYFFSMETKPAASCSLYIIMFSQLTSLLSTLVKSDVPDVSLVLILLMVAGGVAGGMLGSKVNQSISTKGVNKLFVMLMMVIIGISCYNMLHFLHM